MKCPLTITTYGNGEGVTVSHSTDCLRAECAWWVISKEVCAIYGLGIVLTAMKKNIIDIASKTPLSGGK